jgi:hypothetical protein
MKTIIASAGLCVVAFAAATAFADAPPQPQCPSGGDWLMWRLTATPYAETPILAGNKNPKTAIICNCAEQTAEIDAGVWVVTLQEDKARAAHVFGRPITIAKNQPKDANEPPPHDPPIKPGPGQDFYYLPGGSCSSAGPGSVMLRTADHRAVKWGAWKEGK